MKLPLKAFCGLAIAMGACGVNAEVYVNKSIVSVNYDMNVGKTMEENAAKYDRFWLGYVNATTASWGEFVAVVELDDYFLSGENDDHAKGKDSFSTVRTVFDAHLNIGEEKGLNVWLQNFNIAQPTIIENEMFVGVSYDLELGGFTIRPRAAVQYYNLIHMKPYEAVNGDGSSQFSGFNGYIAGVDISKRFEMKLPLSFTFIGDYFGGYDNEYLTKSLSMDDYSYNLNLVVNAHVTKNFTVAIEATKKYNMSGFGENGEFLTFSMRYAF